MNDSPQPLFIYGAPGAGKTTLSVRLKVLLNRPLLEGDFLREVIAQTDRTPQSDPFLFLSTKEAWRQFGELTPENVVKGLEAIRKAMTPFVDNELAIYPQTLILEAAFLDVPRLAGKGKLILVITEDEQQHEAQYFERRERSDRTKEGFRTARMLQDYLIEEATGLSAFTVRNIGDMQETTWQAAKEMGWADDALKAHT
jgi:2-phosphoglycerate kinase